MSFNLSAFLQMGGYAMYVWPAYGICALIMIVQVIQARKN
jgi:heme exporter protein CcmD